MTLSARLEIGAEEDHQHLVFRLLQLYFMYIFVKLQEKKERKKKNSLYPLHHQKNLIGLLSEYKLLKDASFGKCKCVMVGILASPENK